VYKRQGAQRDLLIGGLDDDRLFGGSGADGLHGGEDDDDLKGGGGDDLLIGGLGEDDLIGGGGTDVAVFDGAIGDYEIEIGRRKRVEIEGFDTGEIDVLRGVEQVRFLGSGETWRVTRQGLEKMAGDGAFDAELAERLMALDTAEFDFVGPGGEDLFG